MGRRYIYNKKRRVRKVPNNVVLELENEKHIRNVYVHEPHQTKILPKVQPRTVNLDSELTLSSSLPTIPPDNHDHAGLYQKPVTHDNKLLLNLEHPMTLSIKKQSVVIEHSDDKAGKRLCKKESCEPVYTEMKPDVLNKIKIEPMKRTINSTNSRSLINSKTISQIVTTNSSNAIKNKPTFILVSKTSIDDIGKNTINLIPNPNLRQISFKTLGTRLSNSQTKNVIVQHKPFILPRLASASSSNPIVCVKAPYNESQASENIQNKSKSILQKLTFASNTNPIIIVKKSKRPNGPPCNKNILGQKHKVVNIVEENTSDKNVLNTIPNEDNKIVYPVALKANHIEDSGALEIFSNDVDSDNDEMQILGI